MRPVATILSLLIVFSLNSVGQDSSKKYILALSVELYMNTSYSVSCDNFATAFENILVVNAISNSDSVSRFIYFVSHSKYARSKKSIDVRSKLLYDRDDDHKTIICTDGRNILLNGRLLRREKYFITFLNSMTNQNP